MRIPFVGPSATAYSLNANAERSVNCFLEFQRAEDGVSRPVALCGMPGLLRRAALAGSGAVPVRGAMTMGDYAYFVARDKVYRMDEVYAVSAAAGALGTTSGEIGMASNGTQMLIVDGNKGWLVTGLILTQISDVDFPGTVTRCAYQDGYFLVVGDNSQRIYWSQDPGSGAAWNGLDFGSAEGSPDNIVGIVSSHRILWVAGSDSIELWVNTGDADAPFQRDSNGFIEQGCAAGGTLQKMNNTIYWLGRNKDGHGMVFKAQDYSPIRISTHAVEKAIQGYRDISDAFAYTFEMMGHSFYVLTFPNADATWVYDAATERWFEWLWANPNNSDFHRHRSNCCTFFNGEHLVGDWQTGEVYALSLDTYTDDGDKIRMLRRTQCANDDGARLFFEQLEVDMETGVANAACTDPVVMLRYSNDGGHTWSAEKRRKIGKTGEYGKRVRFGPTGSGRNRVWEIVITDPVKRAIFGAFARVSKGEG